ncbi:hypothetical protein C8Q76DRAFT_482408 [Earliella scabrosa]|nr:hypothetical protein C8Q76DRAFT_482408 [Earliella scabrosa]
MFNSVMQFSVFTFVLSLLAVVSALPLAVRDVFVPPVTSPSTGTVWTIGSQQNVTWDATNPPAQVTNPIGRVVLAKAGRLDFENPIASNFSIFDGFVTVTVPDVEPGTDYTVVLFGDSGNNSEEFTIVSADDLSLEVELNL